MSLLVDTLVYAATTHISLACFDSIRDNIFKSIKLLELFMQKIRCLG